MVASLQAGSKKLGICIPIYRRPELLLGTLSSIARSSKDLSIPIYLADDSCDLTNKEVIERFSSTYPNVHWARNQTNLGIDRNVQASVALAETEYVWLLGEDDRLTLDAVETVLAAINKVSCTFVFANYQCVSNDYSRTTRAKAVDLEQDQEFGAAEFLARYGWATGFLGGCIISREAWSRVRKDPYTGTFFAHVGTIFEASRAGRVYAIAKPIVLNRAENAASFTWSDVALEVTYGWRRLLDLLLPIYGSEVVRRAERAGRVNFRGGSIPWLMSRRADGVFSFAKWKAHVRDSRYGIVFKCLALLVSFAPVGLVSVVKKAVKR